MAANPLKSVVIAAAAANKQWKMVNIVATAAPKGGKGHAQVPAAQNTLKQYPVYQDSGGSIKGLPTVYITGYVGPA